MTITAYSGPVVTFPSSGIPANQNPEHGPSAFMYAAGLLDPRAPFTYTPGQDFGAPTYAFVGGGYMVVDQAPSAISAVNIAASQSPAAGAITLVSSSAAGITVSQSIVRADTGATVTGLLAIDTKMTPVTFGQAATIHVWDPTKAISRNVRITSGGDDTLITFTVNGYDVYNYPMSETITGVNNGAASGKKAFKYISSVTHTGSVATTVTIGTGDVFGFGLRVDRFAYAEITWASARITANTGFVAAVTTSPATAITGDVRGTYATQSASDATRQLQVKVIPSVANLSNSTSLLVGLFGVTQA